MRAWDTGELARYEVTNELLLLVRRDNVDSVISAIPEDHLDDFLQRAHVLAFVPKEQTIDIWGGTTRRPLPGEPVETRTPPNEADRAEQVFAFRDWFARHELVERRVRRSTL